MFLLSLHCHNPDHAWYWYSTNIGLFEGAIYFGFVNQSQLVLATMNELCHYTKCLSLPSSSSKGIKPRKTSLDVSFSIRSVRTRSGSGDVLCWWELVSGGKCESCCWELD